MFSLDDLTEKKNESITTNATFQFFFYNKMASLKKKKMDTINGSTSRSKLT